MGMDPVSLGMLGGSAVGAVSNIFGAKAQQKTNNANLAAQQQQQKYMQGLVSQYLQPSGSTNPYADMISQFTQNAGKPGGAYQYQGSPNSDFNYQAQQAKAPGAYTPQQLGGLDQMQAAQVGSVPQINAPQLQGVGDLSAPGLGQAPQVSSQTIQMPGAIDLPQIDAPAAVGTSGYNAGQDALMQMMRRDVSAPRDASIDPMLQAGTQQFDNSALFAALAPQDKQVLDEQVNQLHGSAGSFGQRFGSSMQKNEAMLRGQFANNVSARNAGIQQQSFEAAQGRNLQGAGVQAGREQFFGQQALQNASLQQQAAGQVGQLGQQNQGLDLQAQQFNVGQNQAAQQFNAQNAIQASLASQGIAAQLGQANAANALQAGGMNQQAQMQYGLQGAQMGMQADQFNLANQLQTQQQNAGYNMQGQQMNQQSALQAALANAGYQQQAGQFNIGNMLQMMQGNQQAGLQAGLQNQQLQGQYGLANQQALNQAGQFNASQNMQNSQFGAQQGNIYNQLMMSGMMNSGNLQNQQQSQNAQLLGILGGMNVPQQQVNPMYGAVGDAAQQAMMMPMLMQMMQQGGGSQYRTPTQGNIPQQQFTLPANLTNLYGRR